MRKYYRPITQIFRDDLVPYIASQLQARTVTDNGDGTQTLYVCDALYAQRKFNVTINSLSYKITAVDQNAGTITVKPNFTGVATIPQWTIFNLYPVYFFHGTPVTTQVELSKIGHANMKTPFIWLWENFTEKTYRDENPERDATLELFALTQSPEKQAQMTHENLQDECVVPMRRLMELLIEVVFQRTDIFYSDDFTNEIEDYEKFGIIARNKGADPAVMMENLSGCGISSLFEFSYKDECPCPPPYIPTPIPPADPWILASGFWNDAGVWIDTSVWID